jgi:two-component system chemotaxis response regulator CheY
VTEETPPSGYLLVVDDTREIRQLFARVLEERGYKVLCVDSGAAALAALEEQKANFGHPLVTTIVSDWVMKNGNGLELLASVRKSPAFRDLPFILISGVVTREQLTSALKLDSDGILLKPFDTDLLVVKIAEAVANRQMKEFNRASRAAT